MGKLNLEQKENLQWKLFSGTHTKYLHKALRVELKLSGVSRSQGEEKDIRNRQTNGQLEELENKDF